VNATPAIGPQLVRAWLGYRRRLNERLAAEGFDDQRFPEALVVRLGRAEGGMTVSQLGRELAITRQGASKLVAALALRGYVTLERSPDDGREKVVRATERARARLAAEQRARRALDLEIRRELGDEVVDALGVLAEYLGDPADGTAVRDLMRRIGGRLGLGDFDGAGGME